MVSYRFVPTARPRGRTTNMPLPDLWRRVYNSNIISMKWRISNARPSRSSGIFGQDRAIDFGDAGRAGKRHRDAHFGLDQRSEEHTSELQSLMRTSYAVFCLKKKNNKKNNID